MSPALNRLTFTIGIVLLLFAALMQGYFPADGDKDWLLMLARRMTEGEKLYVNWLEINPPLIFWLYHIPVYLSNLTGIYEGRVLVVVTLALTLLSLGLCATILKHNDTHLTVRSRAYVLLLLAFILIFWPNSIYFGDREHLFLTLVLPYLLHALPVFSTGTPLPRYTRVAVAVLAALGFCMKPYCLVFFIILQVTRLAHGAKWRDLLCLENFIIGSAWAVYALLIYLVTPEYITFAIPTALAAYGAYKNEPALLFFLSSSSFLSFIFTFAGMKRRVATPYRHSIFFLFALMIAGVWYISLNNGWLYTFYPLNSLVMLGVALMWLEYNWIERQNPDNRKLQWDMKVGRFFCLVVLCFNLMGTLIPHGMTLLTELPKGYREKLGEKLEQVLREEKAKSFGQLFSKYPWSKLAFATDTRFETRFRYAWPLPHYLKGDDAFKQRNAWWVPSYLVRSMTEDLNLKKPQIVFVDTSPKYSHTEKPFDIIAYLTTDEDFRNAWGAYVLTNTVSTCGEKDQFSEKQAEAECQFAVYKRKE